MAIKGIHVGPRSRVLEAKEAESRDLGDRVLGGLLPQGELDKVLYPPTPGPANPTSLHGCGCATYHLPEKQDLEIDGVVHRYSKPCQRVGESKQLGAVVRRVPLEDRVAALEKVVADLVLRVGS
jgi:hypothetical protein